MESKCHFNTSVYSGILMTYLQISMDKVVQNGIADLKHCHSKCRDEIKNLLGDGESIIKSITNVIDEKIQSFDLSTVPNLTLQRDAELEESEGVDIHISPQAKPISEYKVWNSMLILNPFYKSDSSLLFIANSALVEIRYL